MASPVFTHKWQLSLTDDTGTVSSHLATYTADGQVNQNLPIPGPSTNAHFFLGFHKNGIKSVLLGADQDMTVYVNAASSGSPTDTIPLTAGVDKVYTFDGKVGGAALFAADVATGFYVTMAGTTAATLKLRVLYDAATS